MTPQERELLSGLFERIGGTAAAPRDREADAFISEAVRAMPHAPYVMAQTVLVQDEALKAATARIQELEARMAEQERDRSAEPGSFLGGIGKSLFGDGQRRTGSGVPAVGSGQAAQPYAEPPGSVWGRGSLGVAPQNAGMNQAPAQGPWAGQAAAGAGGGFLRSAMTTAAGVAGGALLFSGIQSLMNSHGSGLIPPGHGLAGDTSGIGTGDHSSLAGTGLDDPNLMGTVSHGEQALPDDKQVRRCVGPGRWS